MDFNYSKENSEVVQISIAFTESETLSEEKHMTPLPFILSHGSHYLAWVLLGVGQQWIE